MAFRKYGQDFEISKKIIAKIHEEIYLKINKSQKDRYRIMLSHRPTNVNTVMVYCNGHYLIQGQNHDYQIEGQTIFIKANILRKGEHTFVLKYDYLGDL